jgi:hypothetical protein
MNISYMGITKLISAKPKFTFGEIARLYNQRKGADMKICAIGDNQKNKYQHINSNDDIIGILEGMRKAKR